MLTLGITWVLVAQPAYMSGLERVSTPIVSTFPRCGLSNCSPFVTVMNYKSHGRTTTNPSLVMSTGPAYWNDGKCGLALLFSQNTNKELSLLTDSAWLLSLHVALGFIQSHNSLLSLSVSLCFSAISGS